MEDMIPKSQENVNETVEDMEERLSYMPVGSPGYVKLSEKINYHLGSSENSENSENQRTPENHQIPESRKVSERHSESNQLPESEHSDFQNNNFQNQDSVFQTQNVVESKLHQHNSLENQYSRESIDPMMEISIQEQLKREDCDSLGSASCVSMTSSDDQAEYSPLAPSTMNLTQIDATFKSVGSEVEIMRESVLNEEEEEEESEEIRNVESKNVDTFEQEDDDDGLESYEMIGKSPSVNSMQATEDSYERQPEYAEALLPSISNTQISNAEYEEEIQLEIVSPEHQQSENMATEEKTTNLEEDPATTQNHSYYFGGDDEYLDQMQDAIMEKQQMPVEVLMQRSESRSSSKSEERLEIPGALSLNTSSREALAAEVPETFEERKLEQVELDFLTNSSEKVEAQTSMNTFQTELDEQENDELVDYSLKNDSTTTLNTVYSQGDRFGLDNKVATSSFDETNGYSVPQDREIEMSEVRSSTVTVSPYNSSAESVVVAAIEKKEGGEHESVIATSEKEGKEEEGEHKYNGDQEVVVVQECNIATTAVDTTLVSDYSGVDIETAVDEILENQVESQEFSENTREIVETDNKIVETEKEAEEFLEMDGRDLLDLNNEDKMKYVSDVQDCAKELVENSVQPEPQDIDLIGQYDLVNNTNFDSYQQEEELPIPEPEIRFTEMQEPLENAMRPQTSSSSTSPPPSTSDPESRSHSSTSTDSSKSHGKLQKRWSQEKFIEIVNWHDLRESSVVMVSLMSFIILLMKYPILYLLTNIILTIATGAFFIKIYSKVMSLVKGGPQPDPFEKYLNRESFVSEAQVQRYLIKFSKVVFPAIAEIQHLVLGTDLRQSVVFWIKLYFLSHVTSWFTGLTVLLWSVILAFSLPMIYKKNKVLVDGNLCLINKIYEDSIEKIGKSVGGVMKKFKSD